MMVRVIHFYSAPDSTLIGVVADDAFYYMQMARHRLSDGFWTFDGTSPATGFHLLYGYFLLVVYSVLGDLDWRRLYLLVGVLAAVSIAVAAFLTCRTVETVFERKIIPIAAAPFFTVAALTQSTAMMESWLALLFAALTVFLLTRDNVLTLHRAVGLVGVGILGSLARSDYGMLPGVLFCVFLIGQRFQKNALLTRSALVLTGAIVGVLIVLAQTYAISGEFAQASAQTKLHWSAVQGHTIRVPILLFGPIVFPFFDQTFLLLDAAGREIKLFALLAAAVAFLFVLVRLYGGLKTASDTVPPLLWTGCALTIVGYIAFYRHNSAALQLWYSCNVLVPIAICLSGALLFVFRRHAAGAAIAGLALYAYVGLSNVFAVTWPGQAGMMQAGVFLRDQDAGFKYAAWNAGIISYFSQKPVVNIDGLANDDVLPFITSNTLLDYIKSQNIHYLLDYQGMVTDRYRRARGGYDDPRTDSCLRPGREVVDYLKVIQVTPGCL
mgnify:CR=1 FL=1